MDDGGGTCLCSCTAWLWIHAARLSPSAPHAAVLWISRATATAVWSAHGAAVQSYWGQEKKLLTLQEKPVTRSRTEQLTIQVRRAVHVKSVPPLHIHHGSVLLHRSGVRELQHKMKVILIQTLLLKEKILPRLNLIISDGHLHWKILTGFIPMADSHCRFPLNLIQHLNFQSD